MNLDKLAKSGLKQQHNLRLGGAHFKCLPVGLPASYPTGIATIRVLAPVRKETPLPPDQKQQLLC